ncbi:Hypothetical predicted protein [Lecanosticta acicola]|uniref:Uncharacterized protein n=1 Tax=Lecanosticta acicola TaxID=111012 RepID=A0AAI9E8A0_9PEZI|nr:Hypothetical predicted protein [Lecanosticta acicola]
MDFEYERCADLHNQIIRRGWEATGQDWSDYPSATFWDAHPERHDALSQLAHPKVVQFWQRALDSGQAEHDAPYQYFLYHVYGLAFPDEFRDMMEIMNVDAEAEDRFILLYNAASLESHPAGITLDQETGLCIMQMSLWSSEWEDPLLPWQPLECILEAYIDMIDAGKVIAANWRAPGCEPEGGPDVHDPWLVQSWSQHELQRTLDAYHHLITAVERRMPDLEQEQEDQADDHLAREEDLNQEFYKPGSFVRAFLLKARNPKKKFLKFIGPRIELPSRPNFRSQPFESARSPDRYADHRPAPDADEDEKPYIPILLFPATSQNLNHQLSFLSLDAAREQTQSTLKGRNPFPFFPFASVDNAPAGIYLDPYDPNYWRDHQGTCVLSLPFDLGDGYSRFNDGPAISSRAAKDWEPANSQLYQAYFNPFITRHHIQLYLILESWAHMVEAGHWDVDEHGVVGGVEKFREADESAEMAERYSVPLHW